MGRPSVYGRQLVVSGNNLFCGINLGYNFFCEHEGDVSIIAKGLNTLAEFIYSENRSTKRRFSKSVKKTQRWQSTPFAGGVLLDIVPYCKKSLIIDNSSIIGKYKNYQMKDGEYTMLAIGYFNNDNWHNVHGDRRKFTEEEIMYMPDYQSPMTNFGYLNNIAKGGGAEYGDQSFCASWMCGNVYPCIYIYEQKIDRPCGSIVDCIIKSLTSGNLAICGHEPRLFKDRGLCLVDLENSYLLGRK